MTQQEQQTKIREIVMTISQQTIALDDLAAEEIEHIFPTSDAGRALAESNANYMRQLAHDLKALMAQFSAVAIY